MTEFCDPADSDDDDKKPMLEGFPNIEIRRRHPRTLWLVLLFLALLLIAMGAVLYHTATVALKETLGSARSVISFLVMALGGLLALCAIPELAQRWRRTVRNYM